GSACGIARLRPESDGMSFVVPRLRHEFPILMRPDDAPPLHYLDNAATSQMPEAVIDAIAWFDTHSRANVLRGVHQLAERATIAYGEARAAVARYLGVGDADEVVFTSGTTGAINLVARSYGELLQPGDEIIVSAIEHHSNLIPWQMLRQRRGVVLR